MLYPVELRAQFTNLQGLTISDETVFLHFSRCCSTVNLVKQCKPMKTWARTGHRNLIKHQQSGNYYARTFAGGKEIWKSLKTSHRSVAEARLAEFIKDHRKRLGNGGENSAKMTFEQAAKIHLQNLDNNPRLKPRTQDYWRQRLVALTKSWERLNATEVRKITQSGCKQWAGKYASKASPTNYNNTIALLRQILSCAVDAGVIYANAAAALKRVTIRSKEIVLPSTDKFNALIAEMRNGHGRDSINCADFASGLAFTGCRISEAREIAWRDVDFDAGEIAVRGDADTGTKNWELRRVPLIPDARELFERMRGDRSGESLDARVFRVGECQKSLDRACKKVGADRITHHDLRHLFATRCIESGVDIPTVSRWLGHKDGGALAMKTYGHLRREHSIAQAQRVTFTSVAAKQAELIQFPAKA